MTTDAPDFANTDIVYVGNGEVRCQGNGPATGHPLIYLNMGNKNTISCPYCSRKFVRKE